MSARLEVLAEIFPELDDSEIEWAIIRLQRILASRQASSITKRKSIIR